MEGIKKAIILAAGGGLRLRPLTASTPKCLIEINRKSILLNALEILASNAINETVLVLGYKAARIKSTVGNSFQNMKVTYLKNNIYAKTNNIYSLYLARKHLEKGAILLEGDIFFEGGILSKVLSQERGSYWVVDKFTESCDGCMLITNRDNRIIDIRIVREKLASYKDNFFKSVGILKITAALGKMFKKWLEQEIKNNVREIYYDLVLAKHITEEPIHISKVDGLSWAEIDNQKDLSLARKKFGGRL